MKSPCWIDPPSGWMYGFPKIWDEEVEPDMEKFIIDNGYPVRQAHFACRHMRMWEVKKEKNK